MEIVVKRKFPDEARFEPERKSLEPRRLDNLKRFFGILRQASRQTSKQAFKLTAHRNRKKHIHTFGPAVSGCAVPLTVEIRLVSSFRDRAKVQRGSSKKKSVQSRSLYVAVFLLCFLNLISGAVMKQFWVARNPSAINCPSMSSK